MHANLACMPRLFACLKSSSAAPHESLFVASEPLESSGASGANEPIAYDPHAQDQSAVSAYKAKRCPFRRDAPHGSRKGGSDLLEGISVIVSVAYLCIVHLLHVHGFHFQWKIQNC
ncbi:hypothetical protein C8R43DRAFT_1003992 [Mycena crocata]|nr:hypothetical protein C8R43DRAFT_1003992 [Mycena crocata]